MQGLSILNLSKLNPYSSEEPKPTEAVAARRQYGEVLWLAKGNPSTLFSVFLIGFRYFSYQVATQLYSRGYVNPAPDYTSETFVGY